MSPDRVLVDRLQQHGQSHLLRWWEELNEEERARLASEVGSIDFPQLDRLDRRVGADDATTVPDVDRVQPIEVIRLPQTDGERVVGAGRGEWVPMRWPPARSASFWLPAARGPGWATRGQKGLSRSARFRRRACFRFTPRRSSPWQPGMAETIPLYIMTSPENHEATIDFFESNGRFGLEHVRFFTQGQMPAVDRATGKVLLASKDRVALSPDGHGGTLAALAAPGPRGAQLPGRDARAGRADALLLSGRQSSGSDRRAGVYRPASRGERRGFVQGGRAALAR